MVDEIITKKVEAYNLTPYRDEIRQFVVANKEQLDNFSNMVTTYNELYRSIFLGSEEAKTERFPQAAETYKVYKAALIEACLSGYSAALPEMKGKDAYSTLLIPKLKSVMEDQLKSMSFLENISGEYVDDWILKGESAGFLKLKENREEYRVREKLTDAETGEEVISLTVKEIVSYEDLELEYIDPLDLFVDAYDYLKDPKGCVKIFRSWISPKELLTSNAYPLLTKEDKADIVSAVGRNADVNSVDYKTTYTAASNLGENQTAADKIEVLTFYGDYITSDNKVLTGIRATVVNNKLARLEYDPVSICRLVYAPYKIDRDTHRSISPIACTKPVNILLNRVVDLFIQNLDNASNPIVMYQKGSINRAQADAVKETRQLEYNSLENKPEFFLPPSSPPDGLPLMNLILDQNKNVLGLNQYMAGDGSGAVRTARESNIIYQKANARMRVETDVFSYRFLLNFYLTFYSFNRELAIAAENPLDPIYADPKLKVSISTNASRADKEGELQRLLEMLNLPIAQMIFSNLQPEQVIPAVRYLMAKAELTDVDNLLELIDSATGQPNTVTTPEQDEMEDNIINNGSPPQDNMPVGNITPQVPDISPMETPQGLENIPTDIPIDDMLQ